MTRQRYRDRHGNTVEPAVLDEGGGPFGAFIVRDRFGFSATMRGAPLPRTLEAVARLGVDVDSLEEFDWKKPPA